MDGTDTGNDREGKVRMKGERIYLSTRFYTNHPFKECSPEIELKGLQYLLGRLVEQEKYEIASMVKERIHIVKQQLIHEQTWCVLKGIRFSLN